MASRRTKQGLQNFGSESYLEAVVVAYPWSCVMPSLVSEPRRDADLHFVLCDFGRLGQVFMETDATSAGREDIVRNLLAGEYKRPVRIISLNVAEGWSRDVSAEIAAEVASVAERQGQSITDGTRDFLAACLGRPADALRSARR